MAAATGYRLRSAADVPTAEGKYRSDRASELFQRGHPGPHKLLCHQSLFDETYRMAWRDGGELAQFRKETAEANAGA
jgi:hypothetical protein